MHAELCKSMPHSKAVQKTHEKSVKWLWKSTLEGRNRRLAWAEDLASFTIGWTEVNTQTWRISSKFLAASFFISEGLSLKWRIVSAPNEGTCRKLGSNRKQVNEDEQCGNREGHTVRQQDQ